MRNLKSGDDPDNITEDKVKGQWEANRSLPESETLLAQGKSYNNVIVHHFTIIRIGIITVLRQKVLQELYPSPLLVSSYLLVIPKQHYKLYQVRNLRVIFCMICGEKGLRINLNKWKCYNYI